MLELKPAREGTVTLNVSGKVTRTDTEAQFPALEHLMQQHGAVRVLVELNDFRGWEIDALLSDLEFSMHHHEQIERLAVVGIGDAGPVDSKLTQPLFSSKIRLFGRSQSAAARRWLRDNPPR